MCPSSCGWGPGISKIIAFFCQGSTAGRDFLEEISVLGEHLANPEGPRIDRHSPKGARAKGAWGNLDIGHTNFIPTTYKRHGVTMTVIDSNVYSDNITRKKRAQPKCASFMNHIWFITLFGQARFTPARFADCQIEKNQSREAILKKSSFQYGMKFSIENGCFIPGPSLAAEKQGLGLKFSIENEIFKPRMKISSETCEKLGPLQNRKTPPQVK